ncbi:hypothetical protein GCM10017559_30890 [Streptosporangium longisporum]|uniref:Uncharacterized protein n=1 Tax=Streptosporangium longisporum TaxID=46187 RepID=A0ABN3XXT8_9ACTN
MSRSHTRGGPLPGVEELALDEVLVAADPQRARGPAVLDGVGDQLADDQQAVVEKLVRAPQAKLPADHGAGVAHAQGGGGQQALGRVLGGGFEGRRG